MKIAQIILPWISLPPKNYGGTERIVWTLTEELVKRGHDVTLFAAGDCQTSAKLDYLFVKSLGLQENVSIVLTGSFRPLRHVAYAFSKASEFEIIHSHAQYLGLPFASVVSTPTVHTFHRIYQGSEDEIELLKQYKNQNYVSISNSQRDLGLNFIATVYNGISLEDYIFSDKKGDYLFWSGRILPKKGVLESIEVAKKFGMKLKIAGVVTDGEFFEKNVNPHIDGINVEYLGELSQKEMGQLYKGAYATLFPISWREPFGLVMIESMACGTPVVAYNMGSVPEVVKDGETGFIVNPLDHLSHLSNLRIKTTGVDGLVEALGKIGEIDRRACRRHVEENFTVEKMVDGYEAVYKRILSKSLG